jgi:carboxypeptidase family protein
MFAVLLLALASASVQGRVVFEDAPLPGTEVALVGTSFKTVTNGDGHYVFRNVPSGSYEVEFKLEGLHAERQRVVLSAGSNTLADQAMKPDAMIEEFTIACGAPCSDAHPPQTKWERPTCTDYDLDTALAESIRNGDRSALDLLQKRYATTFTVSEHLRIGGILLHNVQDDAAYWKELSHLADDAVRFAGSDEETQTKFEAYCAQNSLDVDGYASVIYQALEIASRDSRSRALLLAILDSSEKGLVYVAIDGLAAQHDLKSLDAIDAALQRMGDEAKVAALGLAAFASDEADRIAFKYLSEEERADYTTAAERLRATSRVE